MAISMSESKLTQESESKSNLFSADKEARQNTWFYCGKEIAYCYSCQVVERQGNDSMRRTMASIFDFFIVYSKNRIDLNKKMGAHVFPSIQIDCQMCLPIENKWEQIVCLNWQC